MYYVCPSRCLEEPGGFVKPEVCLIKVIVKFKSQREKQSFQFKSFVLLFSPVFMCDMFVEQHASK